MTFECLVSTTDWKSIDDRISGFEIKIPLFFRKMQFTGIAVNTIHRDRLQMDVSVSGRRLARLI